MDVEAKFELGLATQDNIPEEDTYRFVQSMRNPNTVRKTNSDVNIFCTWLKSKNENRSILDLEVNDLDKYLAVFFMTAKKLDDKEYEPETLKSVQSSINRYLKQNNRHINIIEDKEFCHSREVLASKMKLLRQHGKGNKSKQADPLTREEIDILYERNLLGKGNAKAVINTLYINNTLHFGMRSRLEHSNLRWGDVELKLETSGQKYLEFTERATKTRNGVVGGSRPYAPKMYEDKENPRCPVAMYEFYAVKRPPTMLKQEDPFYLGVHRNWAEKGVWYVSLALGKNSLGCLVKTMCTEAGIAGRKVNHSARKTAITAFVHEGVPPTLIQQHSGHKNLASINNYSTASIEQQKHISSVMCKLASTTESREPDTLFQGAEIFQSENFQQNRASQEIVESVLQEIELFENIQNPESSWKTPRGNVSGILTGSTIHGNITINNYSKPVLFMSNSRKRARVIYSDSESD